MMVNAIQSSALVSRLDGAFLIGSSPTGTPSWQAAVQMLLDCINGLQLVLS
jgi:hypothetical protein